MTGSAALSTPWGTPSPSTPFRRQPAVCCHIWPTIPSAAPALIPKGNLHPWWHQYARLSHGTVPGQDVPLGQWWVCIPPSDLHSLIHTRWTQVTPVLTSNIACVEPNRSQLNSRRCRLEQCDSIQRAVFDPWTTFFGPQPTSVECQLMFEAQQPFG